LADLWFAAPSQSETGKAAQSDVNRNLTLMIVLDRIFGGIDGTERASMARKRRTIHWDGGSYQKM
jgi:hypothetical protein